MCFSLGFKNCPQKRVALFPSGPGLYICYSRILQVRKSANTAYFVNKVYWSIAPFLLCIASMAFSFNMVKTKLNCCDRNHMTYKMQNIYHLALLKMSGFFFCYILFICGCIMQFLSFHHEGSRADLKQLGLVISIFTHRAIAGPTVSLQRKGLLTIVEFFLRRAKA